MEILKQGKDLFHGNLRLVLSVVQRFGGRGENPDDLFQIGCVGLIKACLASKSPFFILIKRSCFSSFDSTGNFEVLTPHISTLFIKIIPSF